MDKQFLPKNADTLPPPTQQWLCDVADACGLRDLRAYTLHTYQNTLGLVGANGRTLLCAASVGRLTTKPKPPSLPTGHWHRTELIDFGHLIAHIFGGAGGMDGKWNLIPQRRESNILQYMIVEEPLRAYVGRKNRLDYVVQPIWGDAAAPMPESIRFLIRPEGRVQYYDLQIPNDLPGLYALRLRMQKAREAGDSCLSELLLPLRYEMSAAQMHLRDADVRVSEMLARLHEGGAVGVQKDDWLPPAQELHDGFEHVRKQLAREELRRQPNGYRIGRL